MSVGCFGCGGKPSSFVTLRKFHSEEGDYSMDVIVTTSNQVKRNGKVQIFLSKCVQVNFQQLKVVGNNLIHIRKIQSAIVRIGSLLNSELFTIFLPFSGQQHPLKAPE